MRLWRLLLALYPLAFRRRYGAEMRNLLEQEPVRARTVLDLLLGALRAHLRPPAGLAGELDAGMRVRLGLGGVFACWVAFAAVGFAFYKTTENHPFGSRPLLGDAHLAIQLAAGIASLAAVSVALPLIGLALLRAWGGPDRRRRLIDLVRTPATAVVVFAAATLALVLAAHGERSRLHPGAATQGAFLAWTLVGLACAAACVLSARRTLLRIDLPAVWLARAVRLATLIATAMAAIALATLLYALALLLDAPALAGSANGPFQLVSTGVSLLLEAFAMAVLGALASLSALRSWRAMPARSS
jgi:hypothetical protein